MNKDIAKKWVKALRSGDYIQTEGNLRRNDPDNKEDILSLRNGYCCLGVLSEQIYNLEDVKATGWKYQKKQGYWFNETYGGGTYDTSVPEEVAIIIGITEQAQDNFIAMNDRYGKTFEQIARVIEDDIDE